MAFKIYFCIFCSFLILCWLDIFQLFTFTTINFPDCQMIRTFFFSCHPNIFTLQMKVWAWKRQEKKNCHPSLSRIFAQKIFVLKIDSLNFLRHEQMRYLEFLRIFTAFKAEGSQRKL